MSDTLPDTVDAPTDPEIGTVRWFSAAKRIGMITRGDGSEIFIPPYGFAEPKPDLHTGQPVAFIVKTNAMGLYADQVQAIGDATRVHALVGSAVAQIAADLGETAPWALDQIRRITRFMGDEFALGLVAQAQQIEAAGGMLLPDGSRRRTIGGVFFTIARDQLPPERREAIFPPFKPRRKPKPPRPEGEPPPPPAAPALAPITWADRLPLIAALASASGKATTVKVTIIGRPSRVDEQAQFTLLTLTHSGPLPAMPKGVPVPSIVPATTYAVYIGKKQWKQVAEAIKHPEDALIIEGTQIYDAEAKAITVFATKTTTKLLQQALRQPKSPDANGPGEKSPPA
jgi:cold shock CspA family protein